MRVFAQFVVVCLGVGVVVTTTNGSSSASEGGQASSPARTAAQILVDTRTALGGERLAAIKSFAVTGRTKRVSGNNLVPVEFEIVCELPDKYVRKDEVPAQENEPTSSGFNGDGLIQIPAPVAPPSAPAAAARAAGPSATPPADAGGAARAGGAAPVGARAGGPAGPPVDPRKARVLSVKQDFARLTLGMFAVSFSAYPLTFTYAGQAEAPQGKADVLDVKDAGTFTLRYFVNAANHLPVMVNWKTPRTPALVVIAVPGQPKPPNLPPGASVIEGPAVPAATATQEEKDAFAKAVSALRQQAMAKPVDNWIFYADYRDAGGVQFPFRLRRAIGSDTIEETTFDAFKLNPKIDPRKFEAVK